MKPRKPLRKVSKTRAAEMSRYRKMKREFLRTHDTCFRCGRWLNPWVRDLHHWAGRTHALLCYVPYFHCVCRDCHTWIHDNEKKAQIEGTIAGPKEWGVFPK